MGSGASFVKSPFDYPTSDAAVGGISTQLISRSHLYCLVQHVLEWPQYYCLVDCRNARNYKNDHITGAQHVNDVNASDMNEITVILYASSHTANSIKSFINEMSSASVSPTAVYILNGSFRPFKKKYRVVLSNFKPSAGELPGPIELVPATKNNPAVYSVHRNQFQHCKTTIAYLGCSSVINISSRRLFLKTAAVKLENVQFDSVNEPYDEAIDTFNRYISEKPKSSTKGNILMIDETGNDFATLLVGWWWYKKNYDLEQICEHLTNKMGELDPWYLDVLRAWAENDA